MINTTVLFTHFLIFLFIVGILIGINYILQFIRAFMGGVTMNMGIWDKIALIASLSYVITFLIAIL